MGELNEERMAAAIHATNIANCVGEQCSPEFGGFSGADHDYALMLIEEYERLGPPVRDPDPDLAYRPDGSVVGRVIGWAESEDGRRIPVINPGD